MKLGAQKNLFANVDLFSISAAESLTDHELKAWPPFLEKAKVFGVASALAKFPEDRKQLLALLGQCRVPWWKPTTYMVDWDQTVAQQLRLPTAAGSGSGA